MFKKKLLVYLFAIILIFFGLAGILTSIIFAGKVKEFSASIKDIENINTSVSLSFEAITSVVKNTQTATENIAESINNAKDSLVSASKTASTSSEAVYSIAEITNFDILGYRPMEEASKYFILLGDNLLDLSQNINQTANSLDVNESDIKILGSDFEEIFSRLETISSEMENTMTFISSGNYSGLMNIAIIYIAVLHFMFLITGLALIGLAKQ